MKTDKYQIHEQSLLNKLNDIIKANFHNEQFGVEELSSSIGMSRSNLHRKLKMLRGQSVSQYIRQVRLEEAMELLNRGAGNASEVAFQVGFNSTSYFSTCFQQHYGFTPSEAAKNHENISIQIQHKSIKETTHDGNAVSQNIDKPKYQFPHIANRKSIVLSLIFTALLVCASTLYFTTRAYWQKPKSIAILPLELLSPDESQLYLTEGVHDAMIGSIGEISGFRVISKTSTRKYAESPEKITKIAEELGVNIIIEGSLRPLEEDSLRLQLRLIEIDEEEKQIWTREYYTSINQILELKGKATKEIAAAIDVSLNSDEKRRMAKSREIDTEIYKNYLRGMYYLRKSNQEDFDKGMAYLYKAIELDPAEPFAYAGLAYGYVKLGHSTSNSNDAFSKARAAALKAIELDPDLLEAHAALASIHLYYEWDWKSAEEKFKYCIEKNPSMVDVHYDYSWYLILIGREDEALKEHTIVAELDPLSPYNLAWTASLYTSNGMLEESENYIQRALEIDSLDAIAMLQRALLLDAQGKHEEAIQASLKLAEHFPGWKGQLGSLYAKLGEVDKTFQIIEEVEAWPLSSWRSFVLSTLYASVDDFENAMKWLKYKPHHAFIPWACGMPQYQKFADEPEFQQFIADLNLPPIQSQNQ